MKTLMIGLLAGMSFVAAGCATPGYSGGLPSAHFPNEAATGENSNRVVRNWAYENRQMIDDINSLLLLDPASRMTKWNVR